MNGLLRARDVATILKIHINTVYRQLYSKRLRGFKAGHNWRIKQADLEAFINNGGLSKSNADSKTKKGQKQFANSVPHNKEASS